MIHNYNKKFSELRTSNVCNMKGVKNYRLPSVKGFDSKDGQLPMCNIFILKQCRNKLCKMAHLLLTDMDKAYPEKLVNMLSTVLVVAVTKPGREKMGQLSQTTQSAFPGLWRLNMGILPK